MNTKNESSIRQIIEARANAMRAGDIDATVKDVSDDVMVFDVVEPLCRQGKASLRTRAEEWMESYEGRVDWESHDLQIVTDGDVGFSHSLARVTGTLKTGAAVDMWFRTTLGFRRIDGRWLIVHDHGSVPFNPESGKASLALKPPRE